MWRATAFYALLFGIGINYKERIMNKDNASAERNALFIRQMKLQLKLKAGFSALTVVGGVFALIAELAEIKALRWGAFAAATAAIIICIVAIIISARGRAVYGQIKLEACRYLAHSMGGIVLKGTEAQIFNVADGDVDITIERDGRHIATIQYTEALELAAVEAGSFRLICDYFRAVCYKLAKEGSVPPDIALINGDKKSKKLIYIAANGTLVKNKGEKNFYIKHNIL